MEQLNRADVLIWPRALRAFREALRDEAAALAAAGYDPSDPPWYPLLRDWALRSTP